MNRRHSATVINAQAKQGVIAQHQVLRNTYLLLGLTLLFSAVTAFFAVVTGSTLNPLLSILLMWGLLFAIQANANSAAALPLTFAFTGFMGYSLGPILNLALYQYMNGAEIIMVSTASTGLIFLALSAYVLTTKRDFSFMGGLLFTLLFAGILLSLLAAFTAAPMLFLMVNALMILVFSGLILFHTSQILHGGETNYVLATVSLYLALYNLFVSILQIFMAFSGNDRD